jgi:hypothetical protein
LPFSSLSRTHFLLLVSYLLHLSSFSFFRYDKISQLEDSDNKNTHTGNGYGHDNKGAIGIGIGTGNGDGNGTERDKNDMEERKNSFLSQSDNPLLLRIFNRNFREGNVSNKYVKENITKCFSIIYSAAYTFKMFRFLRI